MQQSPPFGNKTENQLPIFGRHSKIFTVYRRIESIKIQQDYGGFNRIIGFVDLSSSIQTTESNLPNIETKYKNKHDLRSMCIQEDVICGIFQEYL